MSKVVSEIQKRNDRLLGREKKEKKYNYFNSSTHFTNVTTTTNIPTDQMVWYYQNDPGITYTRNEWPTNQWPTFANVDIEANDWHIDGNIDIQYNDEPPHLTMPGIQTQPEQEGFLNRIRRRIFRNE